MVPFEKIVADADKANDRKTIELAERYPCSACQGTGLQDVQLDVDEFEDNECTECAGMGRQEFAEEYAAVDCWLTRNGIQCSTRNEHKLRDALVDMMVDGEGFEWTAEQLQDAAPVVEPMSNHDIEDLVAKLFGAYYEAEKAEGSAAPYASAFGGLAIVIRNVLQDLVNGSTTAKDAIEKEVERARTRHDAVESEAGVLPR